MKFKLKKERKEQLKNALNYNILEILDEDKDNAISMVYAKAQEDIVFGDLIFFMYEKIVIETIKKAVERL